MKQIILCCLSALIGFTSIACERNKSMSILKQYIVNPDGIVSVQFYDKEATVLYKVSTDDIKEIINILNTAKNNKERNDDKMFKMAIPSFDIDIQYSDGHKVNVKLWDNIMYVERIWYQLDIKSIKEIFSRYNKSVK